MDQAITTLRVAWQRRTLFLRPLALPLAVAALVTFFERAIIYALVVPMMERLRDSTALRLVVHAIFTAPLLICKTLAIAMIVAVVADRGTAARWLPTPQALQLAAIMALAALAADDLAVLAGEALLESLMPALHNAEGLSEPGAILRSVVFLFYGLAWPWAAAAIVAIVAARRILPASSERRRRRVTPVLIAVLLVLAIALVDRWVGEALRVLYDSIAGTDDTLLLRPSADVPSWIDAAVTVAGMAIVMPVIAMAIAVAAFADRTAPHASAIADRAGGDQRAN